MRKQKKERQKANDEHLGIINGKSDCEIVRTDGGTDEDEEN